eukprot:CAMPEP_0117562072 /NCGR_PEP_ID=MMETSP0784-20121206/54759_1 /TAXON_ID=39447 /ORGANISM="" /LENGTH=51 /DNA_ID=CAMNT_0005359613 /DNA_START=111 /DNA_END=263 /DNA_ORIENTATION=+
MPAVLVGCPEGLGIRPERNELPLEELACLLQVDDGQAELVRQLLLGHNLAV